MAPLKRKWGSSLVRLSVAVLAVDHEHLRPAVVGPVLDGLLAHLIQQLLAGHGLVHSGVVGNVGRDGQGADGGILVQDDGLQVGARGVQGARAAGGSSADDGHVAFDDLHVHHHGQLGARRGGAISWRRCDCPRWEILRGMS